VTLVPLALASNPLWSLIHETIHDSFDPGARVNRAAGRALAIAFGSPWRILRTGHLLHHRFNRTALDRPDEFDPARASPARAARLLQPAAVRAVRLADPEPDRVLPAAPRPRLGAGALPRRRQFRRACRRRAHARRRA
jgi:fatty acid desaturase